MKFKRLKSKISLIEHKIKCWGNPSQMGEIRLSTLQRNIKKNEKYWY